MIPGVVDSQLAQSGNFDDQLEPPVWLPENALVHLDWVNGNYYWDGQEQNPLDGLGGNYDPTDIDAGLGLLMQLDPNMNGIKLTGTLLTQVVQMMLAGMTVVVDLDADSGGVLTYPEGMILWFMDDEDVNLFNELVSWEPSTTPRAMDFSYPPADTTATTSPMSTEGIQTLAATMNAPESSNRRWGGSINGSDGEFEDVATAVGDTQMSWPNVRLFAIQEFDFGLQDCYARRLTVFPPETDASALALLSQPYFLPIEPTATFADVVFLCGFDGTDGATSATDDSSSAHTITFAGGAALDTGVTIFGTAVLELDATNSEISCPNHANFQFGSGPFVVEATVNVDLYPESGSFSIRCGGTGGQLSWTLNVETPGSSADTFVVSFLWSLDGTNQKSIGVVVPIEVAEGQRHLAVERDENSVIRLFVDGVMVGHRIEAGALHNSTDDFEIIRTVGSVGAARFDEVRITKGASWYAANSLTPPVAAFPRS